jgi:beta-galactosidase
VRKKEGDDLHVQWRVTWEPGELKAVSRLKGKVVLSRVIATAGPAARIELQADRQVLRADVSDLSFITIRIVDAKGHTIPTADNDLQFSVQGAGELAGADNGYQADLEPFKSLDHKAYNGLCLAIVKAGKKPGKITLRVSSKDLPLASISLYSK